MEKKAKIIATLGPSIYSETRLKQLVSLGVDAFRVNFSHNTNGIQKIVSRIRKIEKSTKKKLSLKLVETFLKTKFEGGRHLRRVRKI